MFLSIGAQGGIRTLMPKHYVLSVACMPFHHLGISGGPGRDRTADTGIFSPLLYRLSYRPILVATEGLGPSWSAYETPFVTRQCGHLAGAAGFEPAHHRVKVCCLTRLGYAPISPSLLIL